MDGDWGKERRGGEGEEGGGREEAKEGRSRGEKDSYTHLVGAHSHEGL